MKYGYKKNVLKNMLNNETFRVKWYTDRGIYNVLDRYTRFIYENVA